MPELTRIFAAKGDKSDLEDCKLAVSGLDGKAAGIVTKGNMGTIHFGNIRTYSHNDFVFILQSQNGDGLGSFEYNNVAEVWY